jgi:hypothetical protein
MRRRYTIRIDGCLNHSWQDWFAGLSIGHEKNARGELVRTILSGLFDQSTLYGVLSKLCSLGLSLVSVCREEVRDALDRDRSEAAGGGGR